MIKLEEKDFIIGNKKDYITAQLLREDYNGYIDSILDIIYNLDLTTKELKELGIEIYKNKYDDSWKYAKFNLDIGNSCIFSRRESRYGQKVYKINHELTYIEQNDFDKIISYLSGFGVIGSHQVFSYQEQKETLNFDQGEETIIRLKDGENGETQYAKLGITKRYKFENGTNKYRFMDNSEYNTKFVNIDGKYHTQYFDKENNPLVQEEYVRTSFDSFDKAYTSFTDKVSVFREIIDAKIQEIKKMKNSL